MMSAPLNLVNERFGKLLVLEKTTKRGNKGQVYWKCICDCGKEKITTSGLLKNGQTKSCGCLNRELSRKRFRKEKGLSGFNSLKRGYQWGAKSRNLSWKLTDEQFREIVIKNCYYCNIEPRQEITYYKNRTKEGRDHGLFIYNGLDRINTKNGYFLENVVSCCGNCNKAKMDLNLSEFKELITNIYLHWASK